MSLAYIWGKSLPGGGNSIYKGPEVGMCLTCVHDTRYEHWESSRERVREGTRPDHVRPCRPQ